MCVSRRRAKPAGFASRSTQPTDAAAAAAFDDRHRATSLPLSPSIGLGFGCGDEAKAMSKAVETGPYPAGPSQVRRRQRHGMRRADAR